MNAQYTPVGYITLLTRNRNYRSLWLGEVVSLFGDWFNLIASASLVSSLTNSGLAVGSLFVIRMLAPFLVSPVAGVFADRFNRRTVLILSDFARAAVVVGFMFIREPQHVWLLYALTALQLGISGFFFPARNAILPDIVSRSELGAANALSSATWSVMLALGAAIGGLVAGQWGIYPAFVIDGLSFLLSAFFISRILYQPPEKTGAANSSIRGALEQYMEGMAYLKARPDIFAVTLHKAAASLTVSGIFQVIMVRMAEDVFVIGEGGGTSLGLLFAAAGVGTGIGPILARRFTGDRDLDLRRALSWSYVITVLGLVLIAPLAGLGLVLVGTLLRSFGGGMNWVFSTQILLLALPDRMRGRIFSTEFAFFTLANAVSAAAGGWILDHTGLGLSGTIWLLSLLTLIPGLLWMVWIRSHPLTLIPEAELAPARQEKQVVG